MGQFNVFVNGEAVNFLCEATALKGVKRVANTVLEDISLVVSEKPPVYNTLTDCTAAQVVVVATVGHSALVDTYAQAITGKRELYMMKLVEKPFPDNPHIKQALFIIGSDKRGTMYGLFRLSELCGVSPLVFWGDVAPLKKDTLTLSFDDEIISKTPSVKYRGFFINDEWPAFGRWATERYGDVNALAYDKIFELVLRLKGNYMWPAMWNSSFSQDGPGLKNAELADEYGVIMGASHHEPMCRAGVEWQQQYKNYGDDNTWSFISNESAITQFWKEGIIRNKPFENVITIGMRGESDSHLMQNATVQDNINVLKNAIRTQHQLIKENINANLSEVPRMFAIYKEVEDFFFGGEGYEGMRNWEEIDDVILLLSDDNHGNVRTLPQQDDKPHRGGYGMYYHFDYHGGPVSYEWINSTNIAKAWEQLTMAYEHGMRDMWIVNVGDLKGNEYPLSFFMELAYDYEKWGISNINSAAEYTQQWINTQFLGVDEESKKNIHEILNTFTCLNAARIPESIHPSVYQYNYGELESINKLIENTMQTVELVHAQLTAQALTAYESMVYYPAKASLNSLHVNIIAGMNQLHASRGALVANKYGKLLTTSIDNDKHFVAAFHRFLDGKWNHMMSSAHMGFRSWDDSNWTYPVVHTVVPIVQPKIIVSFLGENSYTLGMSWGQKGGLINDILTRPDKSAITIVIDSRSDMDFTYVLTCDKPWLQIADTKGTSNLQSNPRWMIEARCNRDLLTGADIAHITLDFTFTNGETKRALLEIHANNPEKPSTTAHIWARNHLSIPADNFTKQYNINGEGWRVIPQLGRSGNAIKSFPATKDWETAPACPSVQYDFTIPSAGEYEITFYFSPRNPRTKGGTIHAGYQINQNKSILFNTINPNYYAEHVCKEWSDGVLNNIRKKTVFATFEKGVNQLHFLAIDPNVLLEHIVIYPKGKPPAQTFLPPLESCKL